MFRKLATLLLSAGPAVAEVPAVAVDIPPVHSLVAQVMGELGSPEPVMDPGASPHGYAMRPSEAATLANADVVFWVGPEQTPWLARAISSLAPEALDVPLLDSPGTNALPFREATPLGPHADADDDHGHDDHGQDPHAWLDPDNARAWLSAIAETLSRADPENAATYAANAANGQAAIDALTSEMESILAPVRGRNFIVFHDAYQYFEARFDMSSVAAISLSDAADPGPAHVAALRDLLRDTEIACIFSEPQFNPALIATMTEGTSIRTDVLDPLGQDIPPGPDHYPQLLRDLAQSMATCLAGK